VNTHDGLSTAPNLFLLFCRSSVAIDSLNHRDRAPTIRGDLTR
jgi:hypothetical protein